jgi:hypothetical protein
MGNVRAMHDRCLKRWFEFFDTTGFENIPEPTGAVDR